MVRLIFIMAMLFIIACGSEEESINKEFSDKGTSKLMEKVEKESYTPPRDGNLSVKQIDMYIKVQEAVIVYARQAADNLKKSSEKIDKNDKSESGIGDYMTAFKNLGDVADFMTSDLRAATKLGYNPKEYQWVQEIILKTQAAEIQENAVKYAKSAHSGMKEQLEKQRDAAASKEMRAIFDEQLKLISEGMKEMEKNSLPDEVITEHNKNLLTKYRDRIIGLDAEIRKWTMLEKE